MNADILSTLSGSRQPDAGPDALLMTRVFDAPASLMFSLWTEPRHLKHWMGPHDFQCVHAETDVRVGGSYRILIRSAAKGDNWFGGVYREIERWRRLVFTFAWDNDGPSAGAETLVTLTFAEQDGKTVQTFQQTGFRTAEARDRHFDGWSRTFEKQQAYVGRIAA